MFFFFIMTWDKNGWNCEGVCAVETTYHVTTKRRRRKETFQGEIKMTVFGHFLWNKQENRSLIVDLWINMSLNSQVKNILWCSTGGFQNATLMSPVWLAVCCLLPADVAGEKKKMLFWRSILDDVPQQLGDVGGQKSFLFSWGRLMFMRRGSRVGPGDTSIWDMASFFFSRGKHPRRN